MGIVTYITRASFLVFLKNTDLPKVVYRSLKYIPVAILAALIFPGIFTPQGKLDISITNPYIVAGLVTVISVVISKNSVLSIVLGILSLVGLRQFL